MLINKETIENYNAGIESLTDKSQTVDLNPPHTEAEKLADGLAALINNDLVSNWKDIDWEEMATLLLTTGSTLRLVQQINSYEHKTRLLEFLKQYAPLYAADSLPDADWDSYARFCDRYINIFKEHEKSILTTSEMQAAIEILEVLANDMQNDVDGEETFGKMLAIVEKAKILMKRPPKPKTTGLPPQLCTEAAKQIFAKAETAGLLRKNGNTYHWLDSGALFGYFCAEMSTNLGIRSMNNDIPWQIFLQAMPDMEQKLSSAKSAVNKFDKIGLNPPKHADLVDGLFS